MGRSSKLQAEANRAMIVEKASGLFRAHGIANVSVSDIMKAAGMTAGGFYKHFESKESLAHEVARLTFESSTASWNNISAAQSGTHQQQLARHYFTPRAADKRCPLLAFGGDLMKGENPWLAAEYTNGINTLYQVFAQTDSSEDNNRNLAMFAAMVGANYLSELSNDPDLSARIKQSVLNML